jgi:osmotically-inducible protein OsmY
MTNRTRCAMRRLAGVLLAGGVALGTLAGCAPLIAGGAVVGTGMMASDRRTSGAQIEDQAIEFKIAGRVNEVAPGSHVNATSYNRMVLLTGEVPSGAARTAVEQAAMRVENVRSVVNELAVMGNSSFAARSNDAMLTGIVKATFIDADDLQAQAVKVLTERGTVYLMGLVTEREAARAAELARQVSGVQKVVRVFEILSVDEVRALQPQPSAPPAPSK